LGIQQWREECLNKEEKDGAPNGKNDIKPRKSHQQMLLANQSSLGV